MTKRLSPLFTWRTAITESELPQTRRLVALTLSLHMSEIGDSCWPSLKTLAEESGLSKATVVVALQDLEAAGYLERQEGGGRGKPTLYTAQVPNLSSTQTDTGSVREIDSFVPGGDEETDQSEASAKGSGNWTVSDVERVQQSDPKNRESVHLSKETVQLTEGNCPTDAVAIRKESDKRTSGERQEPLASSTRMRDPIWDTLSQIFGKPATRTEEQLRGKVVKELKAAAATPSEIGRRVRAWPVLFPGATITDAALIKHWTRLDQTIRTPRAESNNTEIEKCPHGLYKIAHCEECVALEVAS